MPRRNLTSADALKPFGPRRQPVVCELLTAWGWLDGDGQPTTPPVFQYCNHKRGEQLPLPLISPPNQYRNV